MKQIINGRLYNTETANEIGSDNNGYDCTNFHWYSETLYQKRTGEFFLFGKGGPLSKYQEVLTSDGRSFSGGSRINPLTTEEAKQWGEEHLDVDRYIEVFGEVEE